jgi:hypothetical protein
MALELLSGFGFDIWARGGSKEFLRADLLHDLSVFEPDVKHPRLFLSHEIYIPPTVRLVADGCLVHFVERGNRIDGGQLFQKSHDFFEISQPPHTGT